MPPAAGHLGSGFDCQAHRRDGAATGRIESAVAEKTDQIGVLMGSFSRMLGTIETQTGEINQFAVRLDAAYRELESTNTRLKEVSFRDEVTHLYNRRFFSIRIEEEVSRYRRFKHPVSVILLDLDGFKAVNDHLGHAVGDETLRGVGELLLKHRAVSTWSAASADEFAVILVETSKAGAHLAPTGSATCSNTTSFRTGSASAEPDASHRRREPWPRIWRARRRGALRRQARGKNRVSSLGRWWRRTMVSAAEPPPQVPAPPTHPPCRSRTARNAGGRPFRDAQPKMGWS
jgi:GGDEF domain-containing protein